MTKNNYTATLSQPFTPLADSRRIVNWAYRSYSVPFIKMDGSYVAKRSGNTLVIARLIEDVGAGNMTTDSQFENARPVLAVHITKKASIDAIRKWLDSMEKAVTPTWQYKDGD